MESGGSITANGGFTQPSPLLSPVNEMPSNNTGKSGSAVSEPPSRDHAQKEGGHKGGLGRNHIVGVIIHHNATHLGEGMVDIMLVVMALTIKIMGVGGIRTV